MTSACGWQSALTRCGGTVSRTDASARYCTGSIVNALAPARIGTAVRFALFSRVLHNEGRIWTVGGIAGSLSAVRAMWLAVVLALASASGVLPRWPIAVLLLAAVVAAAIAWRARDSRPGTKFGHALDVFRVLGRCPRAAAQIAGWVGLSMALRVAAATGIAAAFGVDRPLAAAVLIIPALDLAGILPLTPGNVGVSSAAVAFALSAHGVGSNVAVSAGIALGAVETLTTLALGSASILYFLGRRTGRRPLAHRRGGDDGLLRARRRLRRDRARPARLAPDDSQPHGSGRRQFLRKLGGSSGSSVRRGLVSPVNVGVVRRRLPPRPVATTVTQTWPGEALVDRRAEDDVRVVGRSLTDRLGGVVHLEQGQILAARRSRAGSRGRRRSRCRSAGS